ncbi:hypothetical protein ECANGB1_2640 [Enterospora canceri]|uniref:Uncharacterized protein n=1 Tax=Enterospora canceri TaxID=1081671 RepID=A0A1Y1S8P5_9MICR|nr:hypothetical protein ECANGB1_2640 [Enterospora canceri]
MPICSNGPLNSTTMFLLMMVSFLIRESVSVFRGYSRLAAETGTIAAEIDPKNMFILRGILWI